MNWIQIALVLLPMSASFAQQEVFPLYENGKIPNALAAENLEKTTVNEWGIEFTTETSIPTLAVYQAEKPNGTAVVICPGGGYWGTAGDHEGRQVARAFNEMGVTAFVLKYRMPDPRTSAMPHLAPLQDAQQAMRVARRQAAKWGIRPDRIGIMGFSAGGHLAATTATHFQTPADKANGDTTSIRPNFVVLIYPVIEFNGPRTHTGSRDKLLGAMNNDPEQIAYFSPQEWVKPGCPPVFLVHSQDDEVVPVGNSIAYYQACTEAGVPAEMHLFPQGGHGYGMKYGWMELLKVWLERG